MERTAYIEHHCTLCPRLFKLYRRIFYRRQPSGDYNLSRTVIISNSHVAFHLLKNFLNLTCIKSHYCTHAALACRHCVLHQNSSLTHQADSVQITHPPRRGNGAILAKA